MEKNKSIDGLEIRRNKKATKKTSIDGIATPKKTAKKPAAKTNARRKIIEVKPVVDEPVIEEIEEVTSEELFEEPATEEIVESAEIFEESVEDVEAAIKEDKKALKAERKATKKADKKAEKAAKKAKKVSVDDFLAPVETFNFDSESEELTESNEPMKKAAKEEDELDDKKARKAEKKLAKKAKKEGKKKRSKVKIILLTILVLILGAGCALCIWGNDIIMKITGGRSNIFEAIGSLMGGENYEPLATDANGRTNILAFGTSGYNMDGDEGNGVHDGAQLTDSIMAISIDQNTGDIVMISLPRDLKVSDRCTGTGKINEVYWCHNLNNDNEEAGAQALMKTVNDVLGIDFQYYAHINWGSLIQIVDAIDGITVTLDETIEYDYRDAEGGNHVEVITAGVPTTINGHQALGIARARYQTRMGDFSRGNSQQKILIGIKDQIYAKNLSFDTMLGLFGTLGDNLRTNFSMSNIKTAIHLTFEFDLNSTRQVPLVDYDSGLYYFSTANINGISYVIPSAGEGNYYAIRNRVKEQLSDSPIVRDAARVVILNGTDKAGLAGTAKAELEALGYTIVGIDNAPEGDYKGNTIYMLDERVINTVQALKKHYDVALEKTTAPEGIDTEGVDIVLILGNEEEKPAEEQQ